MSTASIIGIAIGCIGGGFGLAALFVLRNRDLSEGRTKVGNLPTSDNAQSELGTSERRPSNESVLPFQASLHGNHIVRNDAADAYIPDAPMG